MTDSLSFEQLAKLFHMPLSDAAKEIGICCTALKKACRKNNISRWPHRKVKSLDRMIETLDAKATETANLEEADKVKIELEYYKNQRGLIMKSTSGRLIDQAMRIKPSSAISKSSSTSSAPSASSAAFYGAGSPLSSSSATSPTDNALGLSHGSAFSHAVPSSFATDSDSPSSCSGSGSSGSPSSETFQPSPADSDLFDNLIFASEFNLQNNQFQQQQQQQQMMQQRYQDLFQQQQQFQMMQQVSDFFNPAAPQSQSPSQTNQATAGPFFPMKQNQQARSFVPNGNSPMLANPQNMYYFPQPLVDAKGSAFMNPQFMYNFAAPNPMSFSPNAMPGFMFPFGYPFPYSVPANASPSDFQLPARSFPSASSASSSASSAEPLSSTPDSSSFFSSDALDSFVKQESDLGTPFPEYAQAF